MLALMSPELHTTALIIMVRRLASALSSNQPRSFRTGHSGTRSFSRASLPMFGTSCSHSCNSSCLKGYVLHFSLRFTLYVLRVPLINSISNSNKTSNFSETSFLARSISAYIFARLPMIDKEVGMDGTDLSIADTFSLQTGCLDQTAGKITRRVFEHRAHAGAAAVCCVGGRKAAPSWPGSSFRLFPTQRGVG